MKKLIITTLIVLGAAMAFLVSGLTAFAAPKAKTVTVTTGAEFIKAIASNTIIIVDTEFINITEAIYGLEDENLYSESAEEETRNVFCIGEFDGPEFHINAVKNLTIRAGQDVVSIVCNPRYADVINFSNCENVTIEGITFGHTEEGYCSQGVLGFYGCKNFEVLDCDLYGCGTEGIGVYSCEGMYFKGMKIRDCSYHIMHLSQSQGVKFDSCQFFRNREFDQVNIYECENVLFENCMFANNTGNLFNIQCPVVLKNCVILHDSMFYGNTDNIQWNNCITEEYFHSEQALG